MGGFCGALRSVVWSLWGQMAESGHLYQLEKVLPVILRHETEQSQEGPAEGVVAGVAIVGVPASLDAFVALGAVPGSKKRGEAVLGRQES